MISAFFSHSHRDAEVVKRLITLLRSALNLPSDQIRATSVDGFRLPGGASTNEALRTEVHDARVLIGLISMASLESAYVTFELGARWGSGKPMIPLLAPDVGHEALTGPLQGINALSCRSPAQLHQFVAEMAKLLELPLDGAASFQKCIDEVVALPNRATFGSGRIRLPARDPLVEAEDPLVETEQVLEGTCDSCFKGHLYLVVSKVGSNRHYPQVEEGPIICTHGEWKSKAFIGCSDPSGTRYHISLVAFDDHARRMVEFYGEYGRKTGQWIGFIELPQRNRILHRIEVVRR